MLEALAFVDEVIELPDMPDDKDYNKLVMDIKPDVIAITQGDFMKTKKEEHAKAIGAKIIEIKKSADLSSTRLAKLIGLE